MGSDGLLQYNSWFSNALKQSEPTTNVPATLVMMSDLEKMSDAFRTDLMMQTNL